MRSTCGGCGGTLLQPILDLGESPLADDFPATPNEWQPRYPLGLQVCHSCWLVQLSHLVPDEVLWGDRYGFYTGASPSLVGYFAAYANWVKANYPEQAAGRVVEIASNDGTLLKHFPNALGVEPSAGPADAARAQGMAVDGRLFSEAVAWDLLKDDGPADLIIANNVLAHVTDLPDFLSGVRALLKPGGMFIAEVQYLGDLLLGNHFDLVYHEHRSFFSVTTLAHLLSAHGLIPMHVERTPQQGGSIRVVAGRGPNDDTVPTGAAREGWLRGPAAYEGLQGRADLISERLNELLDATPGDVVGYGAPAKATTLIHWAGIADKITAVEDLTPSKVGRYMPGTSIPIESSVRLPYTGLVLAHNYLRQIIRDGCDTHPPLIVPLPVPVLL